ncbi:bifunctional 2-polyprenyl-6-hydroxyphenol methylase/3-demethylubiquinol 3-O-methyltransferase UbiG [Desulfatitalea alkaliphila]|uniref:Bifunctional 2-polyprenyl-6-hydroxyphenol methylase/3-demethylubiquinol 3-O-methyltransferase UbiG n=1 Tax=Desulfatitalea alkaliphila TaxID=2929485 RepID=A0AA41RB07_9BACT|nr:bifunctional 2-polyprenyl-6-hydroxyphenol methylase/3-demethylubiquinol 3-O-methyltransferase UbiG [Desulfatitalea alkaliphila]MCJ8501863.1 bifunctional 2-polyprenyl-6-hydroxyphenol methylase/3-demethylubiquinol 3-O-methyltransferase UbiG [Desulfatitalea alkaliphila]
MGHSGQNVDQEEIDRFGAMAHQWWQPEGPFKGLHDINPVRLAYVARHAELSGRRVLDVGCGGGLLSEAMARAGARVTGIDMAPAALAVARQHAAQNGVNVDYRQAAAETRVGTHAGAYDIVTCMELVEHVPDPAALVAACARLARPGGRLFFATVNRTLLSFLLVILAAEYLLGIVHKGTHHYRKLVRPQELIGWGRAAGLDLTDLSGLRYIPFTGQTRLCGSVRMNYLVCFEKPVTKKSADAK